ncbi:MAG: Imm27 family immunity protein [Gammaproteobacteria bacterium]|nr:Imm27 family immunity protein [Gammaproteobacteria bacterium]
MKISSSETILQGSWIFDGSRNRADQVCERIEWLTTKYLTKLASSPQWGDWEVLFIDPDDGRFWELTYPQGELQGGGPPQLQVVEKDAAQSKYQLDR